MEPSMLSTQGMANNWGQNSDTCYPKRGSTSQGLSSDHETQNLTENEVVISVPNHVQGTQFPSKLIARDEVPQQSRTKCPKQIRVASSKKIKYNVKEPIKQKRYCKPNSKKTTSKYRGVSKCKGRFESFVWDKEPKTTGKKGKSVYIGGFKNELEAVRAYDLIAIKIWGKFANTNFPESCYMKEISEMQSMSVRECILAVRSSFVEASVKEEEKNVTSDALPNLDSTTTQSMLQEIDQESKAPTLQNQHDNVDENNFYNQSQCDDQSPWPDLAFQYDLSFQNDLKFPLWSNDFGSTLVEDHANALGNVLSCESSICQTGNENPPGATNGDVSLFGSSSTGFHSIEQNIQQFEAPKVEHVQRYEPLQYKFPTNTCSQSESMNVDNDFDISQYLNINSPNMDD